MPSKLWWNDVAAQTFLSTSLLTFATGEETLLPRMVDKELVLQQLFIRILLEATTVMRHMKDMTLRSYTSPCERHRRRNR
jgi:hypothetical protein